MWVVEEISLQRKTNINIAKKRIERFDEIGPLLKPLLDDCLFEEAAELLR